MEFVHRLTQIGRVLTLQISTLFFIFQSHIILHKQSTIKYFQIHWNPCNINLSHSTILQEILGKEDKSWKICYISVDHHIKKGLYMSLTLFKNTYI